LSIFPVADMGAADASVTASQMVGTLNELSRARGGVEMDVEIRHDGCDLVDPLR
jgi:hypothetical protein